MTFPGVFVWVNDPTKVRPRKIFARPKLMVGKLRCRKMVGVLRPYLSPRNRGLTINRTNGSSDDREVNVRGNFSSGNTKRQMV